jgi:hypothetical protein
VIDVWLKDRPVSGHILSESLKKVLKQKTDKIFADRVRACLLTKSCSRKNETSSVIIRKNTTVCLIRIYVF